MKVLAEEVRGLTSSKSEIVFKELPGDDPKQREPNIEKARQVLGWQPKIDRINGLKATIDYFCANL
jgi:nucleoside-diphosphate-sugar epimerase